MGARPCGPWRQSEVLKDQFNGQPVLGIHGDLCAEKRRSVGGARVNMRDMVEY